MNENTPTIRRYVARFTLEAVTPFLVGSSSDGLWDSVWVADANGLPVIPGSSLAGVLRMRFAHLVEGKRVDDLFGAVGGHGSRLSVSWAAIHGADGRPVTGLAEPSALESDPVLTFALRGVLRDHVRLNHRGAVDGDGKFDELIVAAGHRFTAEIELTGNAQDAANWDSLLGIVWSGLQIGGKTRRGFGSFRCIALHQAVFDLTGAAGLAAYAAHPVDLAMDSGALAAWHPGIHSSNGLCDVATLTLTPKGLWMFGAGDADDEADMTAKSESRVIWETDGGRVGPPCPVLAGSAIKGALAHRAIFHANAAQLRSAGKGAAKLREEMIAQQDKRGAGSIAEELFGRVADGEEGVPGKIGIDDVYVDSSPTSVLLSHVSVDRFTGGARPGFLFAEKPLGEPDTPITIRIRVAPGLSKTAREALDAALADLIGGRLALGGGTGRGHGVFSGSIAWSIATVRERNHAA